MSNRYDTITVTADVEVSISDIVDKYDWPEMMEAYNLNVDSVLDELDNDDVFAWLEAQDDMRGKLIAQYAQSFVEFTEHHTGIFSTAHCNGETRAVLVQGANGVHVTLSTLAGPQRFTAGDQSSARRMVRGLLLVEAMDSGS